MVSNPSVSDPSLAKAALRTELLALRDALPDQGEKGEIITQSVLSIPEFQRAGCILVYVSVRSEVPTYSLISTALGMGKQVAVPYCDGNSLSLYSLTDFSELESGRFGIPEPRAALRELPARRISRSELDAAVLPGVGFDPCGFRLGYGKGHFDRFLCVGDKTPFLIGLAFETQILSELPREEHDVQVDVVVTETMIYNCRTAALAL